MPERAQEWTGSEWTGSGQPWRPEHPPASMLSLRRQLCGQEFRKVPLAGEAWSCVTVRPRFPANPQDDGCREKSGSVVMPLGLLEQL